MNLSRLINETEDYIENHLSEKITLEILANHFNISKYYYHHLFSNESKETIAQFIDRIKMERSAIYMTICKEVNLTQIALQYGYSDLSSFSKSFKRHFKMSPNEYRKARKDKQ